MNGQCCQCSKWPSGEPPYAPRKWNESGHNVLSSHNCYAYMLNDLFKGPRKYFKPQPGWHHILESKTKNYRGINQLNCQETIKGVKLDNPDNLKVMSLKKGAKYVPSPFHYKGILVVSPDRDYHFARQDNRMLKVYDKIHDFNMSDVQLMRLIIELSKEYMPEIYQYMPKKLTKLKQKLRFLYKNSKTWSHKPGSSTVTDKDGDGRLIFDPLKASWDFSKKGGINYSKNCCFFSIPMNTHANTFSTGTPMITMGASIPTMKARTNISASQRQQMIDKRVRRLLK